MVMLIKQSQHYMYIEAWSNFLGSAFGYFFEGQSENCFAELNLILKQ
jgi:hypothetical protein